LLYWSGREVSKVPHPHPPGFLLSVGMHPPVRDPGEEFRRVTSIEFVTSRLVECCFFLCVYSRFGSQYGYRNRMTETNKIRGRRVEEIHITCSTDRQPARLPPAVFAVRGRGMKRGPCIITGQWCVCSLPFSKKKRTGWDVRTEVGVGRK